MDFTTTAVGVGVLGVGLSSCVAAYSYYYKTLTENNMALLKMKMMEQQIAAFEQQMEQQMDVDGDPTEMDIEDDVFDPNAVPNRGTYQ